MRRTYKYCCCGQSSAQGQIFLLMLGLDNAGKTCTAKALVGDPLSNVAPTVGFSKVQTKYKGYDVIIYDLGGSKSFRGIWSKYFHEVHGFIFVVDSSDDQRVKECSEELKIFLSHDKVQEKPLLLLCNKSDDKNASDELHLVEALNVERLVNEAKCPTRVEPTVATKGTGLKVGYKWLVKTIISKIGELGPRVEKDMEEEKRADAARRDEIRRRIRERKKNENSLENNNVSSEPLREGFVPISELTNLKSKTNKTSNGKSHSAPSPVKTPGSRLRRFKQIFNNKTAPVEESKESNLNASTIFCISTSN